jgi:hypothetical protein
MAESIVNIHAAKTQLSKPVAQLVPAPKRHRRKLPLDDPLLRLDEWSFDGPIGKVTNADIDRIVYGI